ncbi:hypothetical protein HHK36_025036 [Tetracentron sinense]|uniref:Uncharacterized protein n=1 Tax=Tetracentron sinense TaxID=13715 RepID=A0A834YK38_TETSI|nr:hypothetical protein HHK36_025036 [Tetracentron sinense]
MSRHLFHRIQSAMKAYDPYFVLKRNAAGVIGLSSLQKVIVTMRMLAYGVAADAVDDYVRIGESTSIESLRRFVRAVVEVFGEEYLRSPNNDDISRLLAQGVAAFRPAPIFLHRYVICLQLPVTLLPSGLCIKSVFGTLSSPIFMRLSGVEGSIVQKHTTASLDVGETMADIVRLWKMF